MHIVYLSHDLSLCYVPHVTILSLSHPGSNKEIRDEIKQNKTHELAIPTGCELTRKYIKKQKRK
jgi:hypothetical protein